MPDFSLTVTSDDYLPNDDLPTEGADRAQMQKIYSLTYEQALIAQEKWAADGNHDQWERGPFHRWIGAQALKEIHKQYRTRQNPDAVIEALYECAYYSLPIPSWCERAYISAYRNIRQYKAKSWDDVFGKPHPKGTHIATKRQEREMTWRVYSEIQKIKRESPSTPIDGFLFDHIGRKLGIGGKTLTEAYYYEIKKLHPVTTEASASTVIKKKSFPQKS